MSEKEPRPIVFPLGGPKWTPEQAAKATAIVLARKEAGYFEEKEKEGGEEYQKLLRLSDQTREWMRVRTEALRDPQLSSDMRQLITKEVRSMQEKLLALEKEETGEVEKKIQEYTAEIAGLVEDFFNELEAEVYRWASFKYRSKLTKGILGYRGGAGKAKLSQSREEEMRTAIRFVRRYDVPFSGEKIITQINRLDSMIQFMRKTGKIIEDPDVVRQKKSQEIDKTADELIADLEEAH